MTDTVTSKPINILNMSYSANKRFYWVWLRKIQREQMILLPKF